MRVGLITCSALPEPDPDEVLLADALAGEGIEAHWIAWDDGSESWRACDVCVIRSAWNYHHRLEEFRDWVELVGAQSRIYNPAPVVRWNSHKSYLDDLSARGVPTVPTKVLRRGDAIDIPSEWPEVVVKPAVSAGSFGTQRYVDHDAAAAHAREILLERDVLVQPFMKSVEGHGERSLIWIDGEVTHAIRKNPRFAGDDENVSSEAVPISPAERDLAYAAIRAANDSSLLYARIDMAPDDAGRPHLMELELIEPTLFFEQGPHALTRFVAAIRARMS